VNIRLQTGWYFSLPDNQLRECKIVSINGEPSIVFDVEMRCTVPVQPSDVLVEKLESA